MFENKSDIITVIIVVVIIAIIGLLGFWAYDVYTSNDVPPGGYNEFEEPPKNEKPKNEINNVVNNVVDNTVIQKPDINGIDNGLISNTISQGGQSAATYKGFVMVGYIEIPKTGIKYPVLAETTKKAIETSVAILHGPGLNKPGNTVIVGHNYRNGMFFSDNAKITVGDKVYITDLNGNKVTYIVYNTYETTPEDSDYMVRETNGAMEISLSTCTDDSSGRIIIWARAE